MNTGDDGTLRFSLAVDVSQFEAGIASIESMVAKASAKSDVELKKSTKFNSEYRKPSKCRSNYDAKAFRVIRR